jgi:zinc protease
MVWHFLTFFLTPVRKPCDHRLEEVEMRPGLRGKRRKNLSLLLCFFLGSYLYAPSSEAGLREKVSEHVLSNGLKVILLENHKAPVVTFQVWYRVGSRNEQWGKTGLSHMLEHMMFKGTKKYGPEEFSRIVQENGGDENAFTSTDYTAYFENLSADRIHVSLDLESDRMHGLNLREDDFQTERMVVMEERRLRTEDNPQAYLMEQLEATAFQLQPYHWPTIGWMEDIKNLTLTDLKSYYHTYYNPANAFLVVVGDFSSKKLFTDIERASGSLSPGVKPEQKKDVDPPQQGERRILLKRQAQLPFILMGYHVPNLRNGDSYVLEVIAAILAGGRSSRFARKFIQEKQLVLDADAENSLLSKDPGLFLISAEPLPGKSTAEVEKAIDGEIIRLQTEPVGKQELRKAKNLLAASFVSSQDSLFFQAMLLARYEIAQDWRAVDQYLPAIGKVTPQDILRVAKQYLVPENRTVAVLVPLPTQGKKLQGAEFSLESKTVR